MRAICISVNIEEPSGPSKKKEPKEIVKKPFVVGMEPEPGLGKRPRGERDKATDDYHFEKFKKQFRR